MKKSVLFLLLFQAIGLLLPAQSTTLFDDSRVSSIYLELPQDSFEFMFDHLVNNRYTITRFIFDDGIQRDTIEDAGLRLRGNTSLDSRKKSFKVSFDAFSPDRKYQGVKKLNLIGHHNDPTLVREKLFYEVWKKMGMPERRIAFVKVFVNNQYRGLYTNEEEIDKTWLKHTYPDNDGNLYKCTWPAQLLNLGSTEFLYKNILNNPETRAYDLVTNELADDYSHFIAFIMALDKPNTATYPNDINQILNVDAVLRAYAIDVATGNWDDYFYNKNNYYLYDNPTTGRFEYITYDTDNTFGVDWLGKDWAVRNCFAWQKQNEPRPLATKLLAVPAFKEKYVHYLDTLVRFITLPDTIFPRIDALHTLITPAAEADSFRTLDYGYTVADFHNGFDQTIDDHTPYGIKPFLGLRRDSILAQIAGFLTETTQPEIQQPSLFQVFPNPVTDWVFIKSSPAVFSKKIKAEMVDARGRRVKTLEWMAGAVPFGVDVKGLTAGEYWLRVEGNGEVFRIVIF